MRLLLVEDSVDLAETMIERFRKEGHVIDHEVDGAAADVMIKHEAFDLIILDINLPGMSGYDVLKAMRKRNDDTPVILLTARSEIDDRVLGLDSGADDYIVKPFSFRELLARCRVLARRRDGKASNEIVFGNFVFDRGAKRAQKDGVDLELKQREIQLLEILLSNIGRVLSKEEIADKMYSFEEAPTLNAIEQITARLRKKLDNSPVRIKTIRGLGYITHVDD